MADGRTPLAGDHVVEVPLSTVPVVAGPLTMVVAPAARDRDQITVVVAGELDMAGAPPLRQLLVDALQYTPRRVVIDLAALAFIDSTGLGTLVGAHKRAKSNGAELVLRHPTRSVMKVLEMTGLDRVMHIELVEQ
jgi:anti-anti-sigma factor